MSEKALSREFPKSARLLKSREFTFGKFRRVQTDLFRIVVNLEGKGRLGVSISKKVLPNATARNRVRRLIREAFRLQRSDLPSQDIHVVGLSSLKASWKDLKRGDLEAQLSRAKI